MPELRIRLSVVLATLAVGGFGWLVCYVIRSNIQPPLVSWWVVAIILVVFGGLGGFVRHLMSLNLEDLKPNAFFNKAATQSVAVGAIAGLVVPLFLNASASPLIETVIKQLPTGEPVANQSLFFLIGYCVLAGMLGGQFLKRMADQISRDDVAKTKKVSEEANETATKALANVKETERKTLSVLTAIRLFYTNKYPEAEEQLRQHVKTYPQDPEGYAWLAYVGKRMKYDAKELIRHMEKAIDLEVKCPPPGHTGPYFGPPVWLLNLACYYSLDKNIDKAVSLLGKAFEVAKENGNVQFVKNLKEDLTTDDDLSNIRNGSLRPKLDELLARVTQYLNQESNPV